MLPIIKLNVDHTASMALPISQVLAFLWDIKNLSRYEPKVDAVKVFPKSATHGTYLSRGRFAGIPWKGKFSYRRLKNGFTSEMLSKPYDVSVKGGFSVRGGRANGCQVTHFESYGLPLWMIPFVPLMKVYLKLAIRKELWNIRRAVGKRRATSRIPSQSPGGSLPAPKGSPE